MSSAITKAFNKRAEAMLIRYAKQYGKTLGEYFEEQRERRDIWDFYQKFRLYDKDGVRMFEGYCDPEITYTFEPLKFPDKNECTSIKYYNENTKEFEIFHMFSMMVDYTTYIVLDKAIKYLDGKIEQKIIEDFKKRDLYLKAINSFGDGENNYIIHKPSANANIIPIDIKVLCKVEYPYEKAAYIMYKIGEFYHGYRKSKVPVKDYAVKYADEAGLGSELKSFFGKTDKKSPANKIDNKISRNCIVGIKSIKKVNGKYHIEADLSFNQINVQHVYPVLIKQNSLTDELMAYTGRKLRKNINAWLKISNAKFDYNNVRADGEDWSCVCGIKSGKLRITGLVKKGDEIKSYHWYL